MAQRSSKFHFLDRMNLAGLLRLAHIHSGEEMGDAALRRAVDELMIIEAEHRTTRGHENVGFAKASPIACAGEGMAPRTGRSDRVAKDAERYHSANPWRGPALELLAPLPHRQQLAVLIHAAKCDRRTRGPWSKSYDEIVNDLGIYAQRLGFAPGGVAGIFPNAKAITKSSSDARKTDAPRSSGKVGYLRSRPDGPYELRVENKATGYKGDSVSTTPNRPNSSRMRSTGQCIRCIQCIHPKTAHPR